MRKTYRLALVALALILSLSIGPVPVANAQLPPPPTYQAQQFQFDCQQEPGEARDRCINYLGGILDLQRHIKNSGFDGGLFCPPFFLSAEKARQDYLKWGEQNPYLVVGPPIISIVQAFQQAYAC